MNTNQTLIDEINNLKTRIRALETSVNSLTTLNPNVPLVTGAPQQWFELKRDDQTTAIRVGDVTPSDGNYHQVVSLVDGRNTSIVEEDKKGFGISRPLVHYPLYRTDSTSQYTTTSVTFFEAYHGQMESISPRYVATFGYTSVSSEIRILIDNAVYFGPLGFSGSGFLTATIDLSTYDFYAGAAHGISVQVRSITAGQTTQLYVQSSQGYPSA